MATSITTRAGKGSPLTHVEMDANLTNLRDTADAAFEAADGTPVTARITTLAGTDDFIALRAGVPHLVSASVIAAYTGGSPAATAPAALTAGQWTAEPTVTPGEMGINITALPADGGSAITALEYRVGTGAATALTGTGTGLRVVTAGFTAGVAADIQVRAVNAVGAGAWSDTKNRTPAASGGGGALTVVNASSYSTTWDTNHTITIPAVASGNSLIIVSRSVRDDMRVTGSTLDATGVQEGQSGTFYTFRHINNVTDGRTSVTITTYDTGAPASGGLHALVLEVNASAIAPASTQVGQQTTSATSFSHDFTTTAAGACAVAVVNTPGGPTMTGTGGWTAVFATAEWDKFMYTGDLGAAGAKTATATLSASGNARTNILAYAAV